MKKAYKKWSSYEERVLRRCIKKCPENLHYCFFLASKELDRSIKSCSAHYYTKMKKDGSSNLFSLFSLFKNLLNTKNVKKNYGK